jgi:hypothetical protein
MSYRWTRMAPRRGRAVAAASLVTASLAGLLIAGSAQAASSLPSLPVTVTSSSVTVGAVPPAGAVNVVATATGVKEAAVILFLVKPGVSLSEVYSFIENKKLVEDPNNASKYGTIVFDTEASAGAPSEAQTTLQPGQYVALSSVGENPPKAHTAFTVAASGSPVALPTPEATIRTIEFGFRGPKTLHDGELVRFENEGFLVHMNIAFPVKNAKAAKKVIKALLTGKEKQAQKLVVGPPITLAGPLSSGAFQQETINAKPGTYVEACFMATQDGRIHTLLGMERAIKITK